MTNKKNATDACILCSEMACDNCVFNKVLVCGFAPNEQTQRMLKDGYITEEDVNLILRASLEARCV